MAHSYYEESFKLHSENARLRKRIESLEQGLEISKLRNFYEAEIKKHVNKEKKLQKQCDRFHQLWQAAVNELRSKGDVIEILIQLEDARKELDSLRQENADLSAKICELVDVNKHLKAQMNRDYENSSLPSSQKPNHKKIKNSRKPTNRKPGAQTGHAGHRRPHLEPTRKEYIPVPEQILSNPDYYLTGNTITKQYVDIEVSVHVTEYSTPEYRSRSTGKRGHAPFPGGFTNELTYGSNVKALAFLLNNYCNVSLDKTRELIEGISKGKIILSKGLINGLCKEFSAYTSEDRKRIYSRLLQAPVMYSDATNGRVNGKSTFVIVCANENEILYFFRDHKGHAGLKGTPVSEYQQTLVHDHDKTYYSYGAEHQECLAHVLRYLQDSIDNEPDYTWNLQMKEFLSSMIHAVKDRRCSLTEEEILSFEKRYDEILSTGTSEYMQMPPNKYYRDGYNLHKRMEEYRDNHLLFLRHPEIEYTDNISERALRKYKRKQKQAVTFRSSQSVEFLCDAMSIIETNLLQGADIYKTALAAFDKAFTF